MGSIRRPSFLKRQKEQKRLEKATRKREERQARRDAPKEPSEPSDLASSSHDVETAPGPALENSEQDGDGPET